MIRSSLPSTESVPTAGADTASQPSVAAPAASSFRETTETVVFVIVLVLLLKTFVAEAFVIPTGSMATTLWGDQKWVVCPQCAFEFPVNCSTERESAERGGGTDAVTGCTCPNCRLRIPFGPGASQPSCSTGDRVVVSKFLYDLRSDEPNREDVVVFKFPKEPQRNWSALNYIKRLVGLPGETIAIRYGDLHVYSGSRDPAAKPLTYADRARPEDPQDLWLPEYMYADHPEALALFGQGKFGIVRKAPAQVLAMRRIVYDNDRHAQDLDKANLPPRWAPEAGAANPLNGASGDYRTLRRRGQEFDAWKKDGAQAFRHPPRAGDLAWLRYRHLVVDPPRDQHTNLAALGEVKPSLITDFLGYNTFQTQWGRHGFDLPQNWVGDLMLECEIQCAGEPGASAPGGHPQLVLELARGVDRFQARWDLATGVCTLVRINEGKEEVLDSRPSPLRANGTYEVRFANADERLLVWVDGKLPFGDGVTYAGPSQRGPYANDLAPAAIGANGADLAVRKLKLWRDVYYTAQANDQRDAAPERNDWTDPEQWTPLRTLKVATYYVQPDHFLCLGDNSPQSADSRQWGTVPRRLLLGRALLVYYPLSRIRPIR